VTRASFKKYIQKASERAAKNPALHEVSSSCVCLPCMIARYKTLSTSLEARLFEAVERKIAARGAS